MKNFETLVAKYNTALPTLTNLDGSELQLTSKGVLVSTLRDSAGVEAVHKDGDDVSLGVDRGFIGYGVTATTNLVRKLLVDDAGKLITQTSVDFTCGIDADAGCDPTGANAEPGVVGSITSAAYVTVASVPIANTLTLALCGVHFSADGEAQFQLVVTSSGAPVYVRTWVMSEGVGYGQLDFHRPKELTASDASTVLVLKAKALRSGTISASGGINAYIKPE
jgi:hypothetical protein